MSAMHNLHAFVLVAILATLALAAPMPERASGNASSFAVPRVRNSEYVRDPAKAMNRAYRKFGWQMGVPVISGNGVEWTNSSDTPLGEAEGAITSFVRALAASTTSSASTASATAVALSDESGKVTATPAQSGAEYLSQVCK